MTYRESQRDTRSPIDFMARYGALTRAFEAKRSFGQSGRLLRYAAVGVLTVDAPAEVVVDGVHSCESALGEAFPWYRRLTVSGVIRLALSGALYKYQLSPAGFVQAHERVREWSGARAITGIYGLLATLIFCISRGSTEIERHQVERFVELHAHMRKARWFLTGADDYPACAALAGCEGSAKALAARAESMFQTLRSHAGFRWGNALQRASHFLTLTGLEPEAAGSRARAIVEGLRERGCRVSMAEYDEVAIFCAVPLPVAQLCDRVRASYDRLPGFGWADSHGHRFDIAAAVALAELLNDAGSEQLQTLKSLSDLQAIIAAQQAATAAVAASSG